MPRKPIAWPNDARIAILPTIVLETWPEEELGKPGSAQASFRHDFPSGALYNTDIALISDRLYGERCGAYRVLDVLEEFGVKTSWFLNGAGVQAFPGLAKEILMGTINDDLPYTLRTEKGDLVLFSYGIWLTDHQMASSTRKNPRDILQWWKDQFNQLYEEGEKGRPGLMTMGLHPFITGRPFRARVLREFLAYASSKKGVWFARGEEAADHYLKNYRERVVETWPHFGTGLPRPKEQ